MLTNEIWRIDDVRKDCRTRRCRRPRPRAVWRAGASRGEFRFARADRGGESGGQDGALHRQFRRSRTGRHQGIQQALPGDQGRDGARAGRPVITRVRTEAAGGKLIADVVDHSDRALMLPLADLFQDYAPPNAADYDPAALVSPKFWPRATIAWSIAYNTELVKNPPKSWMDLTKPEYD